MLRQCYDFADKTKARILQTGQTADVSLLSRLGVLRPDHRSLFNMPAVKALLRGLRRAAGGVPLLLPAYRKVRDFCKTDAVVTAFYRKTLDRGRLTLPVIEAEKLGPAAGAIELPVHYPLFAGEDAPLADLLFLLNLAKGRRAKRILEVGTYRARTTYALHLNCPEAEVVSYDIQVLDSEFRRQLANSGKVQLRHSSFVAAGAELRKERPFDLIFVDGSHYLEHVKEDSRLALDLLSPDGIIVWHDYRANDYYRNELRVPEALTVLSQRVPIFAIAQTMCAVHFKGKVPNEK